MEKEEELWTIAKKAALRVEFITNGRELHLYTNAIYMAMKWGWGNRLRKVDKQADREQNNIPNNIKI